jgi:hypothetical protein
MKKHANTDTNTSTRGQGTTKTTPAETINAAPTSTQHKPTQDITHDAADVRNFFSPLVTATKTTIPTSTLHAPDSTVINREHTCKDDGYVTMEDDDTEEEDTEEQDDPKAAYWTLVGKKGKRTAPPSPPQHKTSNNKTKKGKGKGKTTSKKHDKNE